MGIALYTAACVSSPGFQSSETAISSIIIYLGVIKSYITDKTEAPSDNTHRGLS